MWVAAVVLVTGVVIVLIFRAVDASHAERDAARKAKEPGAED